MSAFTRRGVVSTLLFVLVGPGGAAPAPLDAQSRADTAAYVTARLDSLMPGWLEALHVPGAAVSIVRGDSVLLASGWGRSHADGPAPVTARTPFRVASLSKLVTATAALRLVDAGALSLDADIAETLGAGTPPRRYPGPVTLHHLLTHTAGFDLSDVSDATLDSARIRRPAEMIERYPEPQVLPPGLAHHYSNFGFTVVGRLVEVAAGMPFEQYVRQAVFEPLAMDRSTFTQPPPDELRSGLAAGHAWTGSGYRRLPLDFSHVAPADAMVTTAEDMGAFMRFHLTGDPGILEPETLRAMHETRFAASPSPYGMAYAFEENVIADRRVLQHAGAQLGVAAFLVLVPEARLGVFVAQNAREGQLRWAILEAVLGALLGDTPRLASHDPGTPDPTLAMDRYTGAYRHTGYTHSTFEKAAAILGFRGSEAIVEAGPEAGTLRINGEVWTHAPALGEHMFVSLRAGWWVKGFLVGDDGRATHHVAGREVLERMAGWERKRVIQLVLMLTTLAAMVTLAAWPLMRRLRRRRHPATGPDGAAGRARRTALAVSALWIVAIVGFFAVMPVLMNRDIQFDYGPPALLLLSLTLLTLASLGNVLLAGLAGLAWARRWWSFPARGWVTVHALLALVAVAALAYMNLLGFRL